MRIVVSGKDVIWNYLGVILSMSINFIMLPILLLFLDDNNLGLWYIFQSIGGISVLFDFGFAPTFGRNIAYCWSGASKLEKKNISKTSDNEVNYYLLKTIISTCKWIYFILSVILLLTLLFLGTIYIIYIADNLSDIQLIMAWLIYVLGIFLNLYYGYYISCLRGVGAISEVNKAMVYGRAIQIILMIVLLYHGCGLIGASISYASYGIVFRGIAKYKFIKYKNIGEKIREIRNKISLYEIIETVKIVWYNAWRDGLVSVADYLSIQATVIICSMFLPLNETGIYSISVQLAQGIATIAAAIFSAYQPSLQSCYTRREMDYVRKILSFIIMVYVLIFISGTFLLCTLGIPIVKIIKPDIDIKMGLLLLLLIYQFLLKLRNCYTSYLSSTNRVIYGRAFILSAILGIILAVILMGFCRLGAWGLVTAQIVAQVVYNIWKWPSLVHRELNLSMKLMFRYSISSILQNIKYI